MVLGIRGANMAITGTKRLIKKEPLIQTPRESKPASEEFLQETSEAVLEARIKGRKESEVWSSAREGFQATKSRRKRD